MTTPASAERSLLHVRVHPRARANAIGAWRGTVLAVSVTAAPTDGRANRAVAALLAKALGVPPSAVELVQGATARDKHFRVGALTLDQVRARLHGSQP